MYLGLLLAAQAALVIRAFFLRAHVTIGWQAEDQSGTYKVIDVAW